MDPFFEFTKLAGSWPAGPAPVERSHLLSLWTFARQLCPPRNSLRDAAVKQLTALFYLPEVSTSWGEEEWLEVVMALRRGSAEEKELVLDAIKERFVRRTPEQLGRLLGVLYGSGADETESSSSEGNEAPPLAGSLGAGATSVQSADRTSAATDVVDSGSGGRASDEDKDIEFLGSYTHSTLSAADTSSLSFPNRALPLTSDPDPIADFPPPSSQIKIPTGKEAAVSFAPGSDSQLQRIMVDSVTGTGDGTTYAPIPNRKRKRRSLTSRIKINPKSSKSVRSVKISVRPPPPLDPTGLAAEALNLNTKQKCPETRILPSTPLSLLADPPGSLEGRESEPGYRRSQRIREKVKRGEELNPSTAPKRRRRKDNSAVTDSQTLGRKLVDSNSNPTSSTSDPAAAASAGAVNELESESSSPVKSPRKSKRPMLGYFNLVQCLGRKTPKQPPDLAKKSKRSSKTHSPSSMPVLQPQSSSHAAKKSNPASATLTSPLPQDKRSFATPSGEKETAAEKAENTDPPSTASLDVADASLLSSSSDDSGNASFDSISEEAAAAAHTRSPSSPPQEQHEQDGNDAAGSTGLIEGAEATACKSQSDGPGPSFETPLDSDDADASVCKDSLKGSFEGPASVLSLCRTSPPSQANPVESEQGRWIQDFPQKDGYEMDPNSVELKVSQIANQSFQPTSNHTCCIPIDIQKWEAIVSYCGPDSVLILPEGSFSFPLGYNIKSSVSGLTISGKGAGKTILCIYRNEVHGWKPCGKSPQENVLNLCSQLTLTNLCLKSGKSETFWWPCLQLCADRCSIKRVKFYGCELSLDSKFNLVEHCHFHGGSLLENPNAETLRSNYLSQAISLLADKGGNTVRNITIQNTFFGILKLNSTQEPGTRTELDLISNVRCRNVWVGLSLENCHGNSVKNMYYEWSLDNKFENERHPDYTNPTALELAGGERNKVDGIFCHGKRSNFYGYIARSDKELPKGRRNRVTNVKGAGGRFLDDGKGTESYDVES